MYPRTPKYQVPQNINPFRNSESNSQLKTEKFLIKKRIISPKPIKKIFMTPEYLKFKSTLAKTKQDDLNSNLANSRSKKALIKIPEFSPFMNTSEELNRAFGAPLKRAKSSSRAAAVPQKSKIPARAKNLTPMNAAGVGNDSANTPNLKEGMRVIHDRFGMGVVKELEGAIGDQKATITFENAGEKKLLLKFAKLRIMSNG